MHPSRSDRQTNCSRRAATGAPIHRYVDQHDVPTGASRPRVVPVCRGTEARISPALRRARLNLHVPKPFPWLYPYAAEPVRRRGREVLRPVVTLSIPGRLETMEPSWALVDSGSENVFAADWLAELAGIDLSTSLDRTLVGIGGQVVEVAYAEVELGLHAPDGDDLVPGEPTWGLCRSGERRFPSWSANSASSTSSP